MLCEPPGLLHTIKPHLAPHISHNILAKGLSSFITLCNAIGGDPNGGNKQPVVENMRDSRALSGWGLDEDQRASFGISGKTNHDM